MMDVLGHTMVEVQEDRIFVDRNRPYFKSVDCQILLVDCREQKSKTVGCSQAIFENL